MNRNVAVIGAGNIGMRHLEMLRQIDGVMPVVVSRRTERLGELARRGYATAVDIEAAARMGVSACIVASETRRHAVDSLDAARFGMSVLVEKPMAVDAAEARSMRGADHKIYVGCVLRFSASLGVFREQLHKIGRVHSVRIECQSYLPDWRPDRPYRETYSASAAEGGALRDLIHEIDYAGWIFGWPKAVQARVRNLGRLGIAAEESAELLWEVAAGPVVSMALDYVTRPARRRMRASGEQGTLEWDGIEGTVTLTPEELGSIRMLTPSPLPHGEGMLLKQDAAFVASAMGGTLDPRLATAEDGIRALAICDAARLASAIGRCETVDYK